MPTPTKNTPGHACSAGTRDGPDGVAPVVVQEPDGPDRRPERPADVPGPQVRPESAADGPGPGQAPEPAADGADRQQAVQQQPPPAHQQPPPAHQQPPPAHQQPPPAHQQPPAVDEQPPPGGGVMRRLSAGSAGFGGVFSAVEQFWAPGHYDARQEIEQQRRVGKPLPAPTDPPDLQSGDDPRSRFRGRIVIRHARAREPVSAPDSEAQAEPDAAPDTETQAGPDAAADSEAPPGPGSPPQN